jgi:type I restriction enzyme R subunit
MLPFSDSIFQLGGRVTMSLNEADTRYHLIDPVLRAKGYVSRDQVTLETVLTPPPVEPTG